MRSRILIPALLVLGALLAAFALYTRAASAPLFDEPRGPFAPRIAPVDEALTFARSRDRLLLVTDQDDRVVRGRDLTAHLGPDRTADLLALYRELGFDGVSSLRAPEVEIPLAALRNPVDYRGPHVAAGTNFKAHAEEVHLDDPPCLFPKRVEATGWNADVPYTDRLDYEAELCMIPLDDIVSPDSEVEYALVLCNDFTDRWTLVRDIDLSGPLGRTGFPTGKGCPGCLVTGYLVVIPRDPDFHRSLELQLFVEDALRQRFVMDQMILSIDDIVAQAFAEADAPFAYGDEFVSLLPAGRIPAGTLVLTGTAAGIAFKPVNIWSQRFYLQPGDVVRTEGRFLGHLENRVGSD